MLQHSETESKEEKTSKSLKDTRWSISRFLLTAQVQCLSGLVEYVVVARRKGVYEFVCPTEVLPNFVFERLAAVPEDWCAVIETILLDNCLEHRSTNRLCVTLLERWILQPIHKSHSSIHSVSSIDTVFHEIKRYCASSLLAQWLNGHPHTRRHKLTHRICTLHESSPSLGVSFLMDRSELVGMFSFGDSDSGGGDDDGDVDAYSPIDPALLKQAAPLSNYRQSSPNKLDEAVVNCHTNTTVTTISFPPVHVDAGRLLHVSVSSPQSLPTSAPHCPFCFVCGAQEPTIGNVDNRPHTVPLDLSTSASSSSCTSSTSLSSQSDATASDPIPEAMSTKTGCCNSFNPWISIDAHTHENTSSCLAVPSSPLSSSSAIRNKTNNPYTETVKSPMVVMTDAADHFFSGDNIWSSEAATAFYHRFPSLLGTEFDTTGSGSSTLTKKSRATTPPPIEPIDRTLESPPRKQQRMFSADPGSSGQASTRGDHPKQGTMEKVIDKFTQMNVQRDEAMGASGLLNDLTAAFLPTNSAQVTALSGTTKRAHEATDAPEAPTESPKNVMEQAQRTGRRRNASSICVSAWPSWTRDSVPFFNRRTGLPLQSSPVPLKRSTSGKFDFDASLCPLKSSKSSTCMVYGSEQRGDTSSDPPMASCVTSNGSSIPNGTMQTPTTRTNHNTTNSIANNSERQSTKGKSPPSIQPRRRPASLRLTVPPTTHPPFTNSSGSVALTDNGDGNTRHVVSGRRRTCPSDVDQAEVSCSAPPSGNRSLRLVSDRLANTLACTPVSHASSQHLLVNFEESMLNGRIHPVGQVEGFTLELGASGSFFPAHTRIPMNAYFFDLSDDNTPSPYLGFADLSHLRHGKGYHVPKKGSVQLTLFNPNKFVVKMFVIGYDFEDMPPNSQTFLRQRTVYMPIQSTVDPNGSTCLEPPSTSNSDRHSVPNLFWAGQDSLAASAHTTASVVADSHIADRRYSTAAAVGRSQGDQATSFHSSSSSSSCCCCSCSCSVASSSSHSSTCSLASQCSNHFHTANSIGSAVRTEQPAYLRYLVHLRFHTTRSGRLYLHTDLRLIFARDKFEFDPRVATYELRSFVDAPTNPRYSPKKWTKPRGSSRSKPFVTHINTITP